MDFEMSSTYRIKSRGPKIDPLGTPEVTEHHEENKSFKDTLCLRVVKKHLNQANKALPIPYNCSLNNNLSCGTESNALDMSRNKQCVLRLHSKLEAQSSTAVVNRHAFYENQTGGLAVGYVILTWYKDVCEQFSLNNTSQTNWAIITHRLLVTPFMNWANVSTNPVYRKHRV